MPYSQEEQRARARRRLEAPDEAWDLDTAGSTVVGSVREITKGATGYGPYPIVVIETDDKIVTVYCGRTVLRDEMHSRDVRLGDVLGFKYIGARETRTGGKYHDYKMVHEPGDRHEDPENPTSTDPTDEEF